MNILIQYCIHKCISNRILMIKKTTIYGLSMKFWYIYVWVKDKIITYCICRLDCVSMSIFLWNIIWLCVWQNVNSFLRVPIRNALIGICLDVVTDGKRSNTGMCLPIRRMWCVFYLGICPCIWNCFYVVACECIFFLSEIFITRGWEISHAKIM